MKKHLVLYKKLSPTLMARLQEQAQVTLIETLDAAGLNALRQALPSADGLLGASLRLDAELLDLAPRLRAVASVSVGVDNYDIDYLTQRRILLSNTPDVLTETTADTGFALILAAARRVVELANLVRAGQWQRNIGPAHFGTDVHGKTLGIIGMGRIGEALAQRGHFGFGMPLIYHSTRPKPAVEQRFNAQYRSLEQLLEEADFICLTLPLTERTQGLIGAREFALMRPESIFINISRGKVVDEAALIEALQQRRIRGAGLDVFEREPLDHDSPLLQMPNVVATAHRLGHPRNPRSHGPLRSGQPPGGPGRPAPTEPGQPRGVDQPAPLTASLRSAPEERPIAGNAHVGAGLPAKAATRAAQGSRACPPASRLLRRKAYRRWGFQVGKGYRASSNWSRRGKTRGWSSARCCRRWR